MFNSAFLTPKGIALGFPFTFLFTSMWAVGKAAAPHYPIGEIVFFRSLLAMGVLVCWAGRGSRSFRPRCARAGRSAMSRGG